MAAEVFDKFRSSENLLNIEMGGGVETENVATVLPGEESTLENPGSESTTDASGNDCPAINHIAPTPHDSIDMVGQTQPSDTQNLLRDGDACPTNLENLSKQPPTSSPSGPASVLTRTFWTTAD